MTTRRILLNATPALAASLCLARAVDAADTAKPGPRADFLFVQTSKAMRFDQTTGTLTLAGISSVTTFFSDRPERIAGNMRTASFVPFWSDGKDSFLADPPNADVSILDGTRLHQIVVVLRNPVLEADNLSYTVKLLQGEMPAKGNDVSVFIDVIGMPMTPLSFAGARRRAFRRVYLYR